MDEVHGFCVRMLGPGEAAGAAAQAARTARGGDRVTLLAAAAVACREREATGSREGREGREPPASSGPVRPEDPQSAGDDRGAEPATEDPQGPTEPETGDDPRTGEAGTEQDRRPGAPKPDAAPTLAEAVAAELAQATGRLPERQREALALRELLGLPHDEISRIVGVEIVAVAPLLARSRLRLRGELRGDSPPAPECPERDRALRTIALRQDGEDVPGADDEWLVEHLGHCEGCGHAHAAMLEASACYQAWQLPEVEPAAAGR